ncbi:MAG: hypothetical protein JF609_05645 [Verrucomicrobia bacterium]|nr:hypothetical protein [Verrucomicrobiota bacterium]
MKLMKVLALTLLGVSGWGLAALAETNDTIHTDIEIFETQTNVLVVKGFGTGGTVSVGAGLLAVRLKESYSPDVGNKLQGLVLDYSEGGEHQRAVIDYAEVDSLLRAVDFIKSATYDVTGLPGFEAVYQTRDGFRVTGVGAHRQSSVQTYVQFAGCQRILLDSDQMSQLRNAISQARNTLDQLKSPK